ncbi:hypothetical protein AAHE18_12G103500 [Arachis hypogaea]
MALNMLKRQIPLVNSFVLQISFTIYIIPVFLTTSAVSISLHLHHNRTTPAKAPIAVTALAHSKNIPEEHSYRLVVLPLSAASATQNRTSLLPIDGSLRSESPN